MAERSFTTSDLLNLILASIAGGAVSNIINLADIPEKVADATSSGLFVAWGMIFIIVVVALLWRF